jgi:hypothetical protein
MALMARGITNMKTKIKWQKDYIGHKAELDGFEISRVGLQSGRFHYYVHWFENPHYAAPHSRLSQPMASMAQLKKLIKRLQSNPNCVNRTQLQQIKAA